MKLYLYVFLGALCGCLQAAEPTLLFSDDCARDEATPGKEDIGSGWTSNSGWRAKGHQQVDLKDGVMHVTKHAEADHGVAIFHDVSFQDGMVELKFKLAYGDDLGLDFVDRELKTVHAGHLCMARVAPSGIILIDSKTGSMNNEIKERREKGDKSPELAALLKSKSKIIKFNLKAEEWHTMHITIEGDTMTAKIDGKEVGSFSSEGIAHPTKRMITLAVNKSAQVDDVKVWKLK
ncbi:MAG: family 16 glycoside hydrolase [Prosthecobacter sp.]